MKVIKTLRPEHQGEGRYPRKWAAHAFNFVCGAVYGTAIGCLLVTAVAVSVALIHLFPWGLPS